MAGLDGRSGLSALAKMAAEGQLFLWPAGDTVSAKQANQGASAAIGCAKLGFLRPGGRFQTEGIHMKKVLFAAALSAACGLASAQGYAGAVAGLSKANLDCASRTCDDSSTGVKVYGGYEVDPNISIEAGYINFGKAKIKFSNSTFTADIKGSAFVVTSAFRFPIATQLTGVGRVGLARVTGKFATDVPGVKNTSTSATKLYTGLGLEYAIAKNIKVVGAFDFTGADVEIGNSTESNSVFLLGGGLQAAF
jgi:OOP family OmpA-OmpF porin